MFTGPNIITDGLVLYLDTGNGKSYRGQPTTNIGNNFRDFTGTGYSPDGEWVSSPTRFTKTYYPNLTTPIGPGGTLIEESGTGGYHHLSRYGGGSESGAHSLSCYIYPLVSGITDFCIGMLGDSSNNIRFNLDTRVITYGGGISNTNAFIRDIPGWPGWLRVGANIEGRGGGWVGCFGYTSYTTYTGTAGGKKAYITGIQYEYTTQPTPFVAGTRSATQGLLPLVGNSTIDLSNVSFDSNAQITFDGTDDTISVPSYLAIELEDNVSIEYVYMRLSTDSILDIIANKYHSTGWELFCTTANTFALAGRNGDGTYYSTSNAAYTIDNNKYYHLVAMKEGLSWRLYVNGELYAYLTANSVGTWSNSGIIQIGGEGNGYYPNMKLPILKIYNKALTAQEVKQNYNAVKGRFGL